MLPLPNYSIRPSWKEVIVMTAIITSLVVGVVASIVGNYIYDKFIK